ncbi:MAG: hypothetical protein NXI20_00485 [bacterium]|nr:hypothetical protein [bacterium]
MGAGIGFVRDAQNSARQNRDQLKNKSSFDKSLAGKGHSKPLKFKEATPEQMEKLRNELVETRKKETLRMIIVGTMLVVICTLTIWFLIS